MSAVLTTIGISWLVVSGGLGLLVSVAAAKRGQREEAYQDLWIQQLEHKRKFAQRRTL